MSDWINRNFDIDLWIKLAADNPYKFESQRQQWLEDTISEANPELKPRLLGLQWEINMDMEIAKNKYTHCKFISHRVVEHLRAIKDLMSGNLPIINKYPATIINFVAKNDHPH
jgi:Protein of unknown function (DUF3135)